MSDIALFQQDDGTVDAVLFAGDLVADESLRPAVAVSIFSDAENDDAADGDRRGYWADVLSSIQGDRTGSLIWLLAREKTTDQIPARAKRYAEQSLAWMLKDGVARSVIVASQYDDNKVLWITVEIDGPNGVQKLRFAALWAASLGDPLAVPNAIADATARTAAALENLFLVKYSEII
jgi:phage gp46-like protein